MAVPLYAYAETETTPEAVQSELPSGYASWPSFTGSCTVKDKFGEESKLDVALFFDIGKGRTQEVAKYNLGEKTAFWFLEVGDSYESLSIKMYFFKGERVWKYDSSNTQDAVPILETWPKLDVLVLKNCPDLSESMMRFLLNIENSIPDKQ